jgi:hypothetical protein
MSRIAKTIPRRSRTLTVSLVHREWGKPHRRQHCWVPLLRLNGNWLAGLGFVAGTKVNVEIAGETLTLRSVQSPAEPSHANGLTAATRIESRHNC